MDQKVFSNIGKILEQDSKTSTYKYALLRGVIDIIQENSPYSLIEKNRVFIPTGLLVEKWLIYYYPLLENKALIPQINGNANLAFGKKFIELISIYRSRGGYSAFYNDLKNKGIPKDISLLFFELVKCIRDTITKMPMRHIGHSINKEFYSIFKYENQKLTKYKTIDLESLILDFGTFSIPTPYYNAFKILGSFINGQDSILFKWAEFSVNASKKSLSLNNVLNEVVKSPITERNIIESKRLYKEILQTQGKIYCVWTGKRISNYDIDHIIPFSIWKNNDLWNLLPSDSKINKQKRDKIPSPNLIHRQSEIILDYWQIINNNQSNKFQKQFQTALLGKNSFNRWKELGITQLQNRCAYLIDNRGYSEWKI